MIEIKIRALFSQFIDRLSKDIPDGGCVLVVHNGISENFKNLLDKNFRIKYVHSSMIFSKRLMDNFDMGMYKNIIVVGNINSIFCGKYLANKHNLPVFIFADSISLLEVGENCIIYNDYYQVVKVNYPKIFYCANVDKVKLFYELFSKFTAIFDYYVSAVVWNNEIDKHNYNLIFTKLITLIKQLLNSFDSATIENNLIKCFQALIKHESILYGGEWQMALFMMGAKQDDDNIFYYMYFCSQRLSVFYYKLLSATLKSFIPPPDNNARYERICLALNVYGVKVFNNILKAPSNTIEYEHKYYYYKDDLAFIIKKILTLQKHVNKIQSRMDNTDILIKNSEVFAALSLSPDTHFQKTLLSFYKQLGALDTLFYKNLYIG